MSAISRLLAAVGERDEGDVDRLAGRRSRGRHRPAVESFGLTISAAMRWVSQLISPPHAAWTPFTQIGVERRVGGSWR